MIASWILPLLLAVAPIPSNEDHADGHHAKDIHSFGNPDEVRPTHLALDLTLDFDRQVVHGSVTTDFERVGRTRRLVLDIRDIIVERVIGILESGSAERPLTYTVHAPTPGIGSALEIDLPLEVTKVRVEYQTVPSATAIDWLDPEQTSSGKLPFLFTQSQSIHVRSWIPCMDSPGVRVTYEAVVRVPDGITAVMSAAPGEVDSESGVFRFRMPQAIPSYLIALAAGELTSRDVGPRVRVYAEPALVEAAAYEFGDTERMIDTVESLYGPYAWDRYDLLVLPPSFPFGGMENPRLSFITPTVLSGDRTLTSLIAHELAHSWSGNLVTNATWSDFWINEGFTVYVERRVVEALYGRELSEMEALLGLRDLEEDIEAFGKDHEFTKLEQDLTGHDPDDAFSSVPYEKGYLFLRLLDEHVGRERFDAFLREIFKKYAFGNLSTGEIEREIRERLLGGDTSIAERLRLEEWLRSPGLPSNVPDIRSEAFERVEREVERFANGTRAGELAVDGWVTAHWMQFLRKLPSPLPADRLDDLDAAFRFTESRNSEIFFAWAMLAARSGYAKAYPAIERFLASMGRNKFLRPLYGALLEQSSSVDLAKDLYRRTRASYHPLSKIAIDQLMERAASPSPR